MSPRFTVFTPTFNRAHTLPRVHESLQRQTTRDFEWLIVDDGSTDETASLVESWMARGGLDIRYLSQPNGGKHVAHNRAVDAARGELFTVLDSDDAVVPHAIERLLAIWDTIPAAERDRFSGVGVLCATPDGAVVGTPYPRSPMDTDLRELVYRYGNAGEKWGCHRTEILRRHRFDESVRGLLPESFVWFEVARRYRIRCVNEPLRIYYTDEAETLSRAPSPVRHASGKRIAYRQFIDHDLDYFWRAPVRLAVYAAYYARFSWHVGDSVRDQRRALHTRGARWLHALMLPAGLGFYLNDRLHGHAARD